MCMIEFKTDRELVNYIGNEKVEMIGTGTEGSVFLTKEDDTIKYIKRRYRILYNPSIITSSLFKLDSFFFPTEIIIDDSRNLILFPTLSYKNEKNIWVVYNNLIDYKKYNLDNTLFLFKNNNDIKVNVRFNIVDNQVVRCLKLDAIISKRKEIK